MIYYLAPRGRCGIQHYIHGRWRGRQIPPIRQADYEDVFHRDELPAGTWIFSGIEQLTPAGVRLAETVAAALTDAGQRVLNRPGRLLSRHDLLEAMHRNGINDFRSYKPGRIPRNVRYPVFVREVEDHTGSMSDLLHNRRELALFLVWQRLRGYRKDDLLVVEYCDTSDSNGEYRKYSAQCVNGTAAARYLHVDRQWMVKSHADDYQDEWADTEREFIEANEHADQVRNIFKIANVDYGRIDYGMLDGRLQVWEINTNPTIGRGPDEGPVPDDVERIRRLEEPGRAVFFARFQAMLEAIDTNSDNQPGIALSLPKDDVDEWQRECHAIEKLQERRDLLGKVGTLPGVKQVRDFARTLLGVSYG